MLRRMLVVVLALAALVIAGTAIAQAPVRPGASSSVVGTQDVHARAMPGKPNIVLVVMDDFSLDLMQTMRSVKQMRRMGADYTHAFAVDSLCCVSRSSIFTGQYPHQTGVLANTSNNGTSTLGGFKAFQAGGNPSRSFNVRLQQAGYTTGFIGKYLNEYEWVPGRAIPPVMPGWSYFNVVFGSAYDGWDFGSTSLSGGKLSVRQHGAPPLSAPEKQRDDANAATYISKSANSFIKQRSRSGQPYFLEVAVYAPHNRTQPQGFYPGDPIFPPMFRDRPSGGRLGNCGPVTCTSLTTADLPGFGDRAKNNRPVTIDGKPARQWNTRGNPFRAATSVNDLRNRAMMVQSVDRMMRKILKQVDDNTYVLLTSDNGFHLGQLGMGRGKGTAYDTDSHVPLLVVGPGVVRGKRAEVTNNIDLAPTFEELAGLTPAAYRSGVSLVPTFTDTKTVRRNYAFLEHTQQSMVYGDPDRAYNGDELDRVPSFVAVRSRTGLLVRYDLAPEPGKVSHGYEFYSYAKRTWEKANQFTQPRYAAEVQTLLGKLDGWDKCAHLRGDDAVPPQCRNLTQ